MMRDGGGMPKVQITLDARATTNLALAHAGVPLVGAIRVRNTGSERIEGAVLTLELGPDLGLPVHRALPELHLGEVVELDAVELVLPAERLHTVVEAERARLSCGLTVGDEVLGVAEHPVEVLAWNEWLGDRAPPSLLAVFVTPNHPVVATVLRRVRDRLGEDGDPAIDGYQRRSPARTLRQVRALYETLQSFGLTYVGVPASFEAVGQKVRLPPPRPPGTATGCGSRCCAGSAGACTGSGRPTGGSRATASESAWRPRSWMRWPFPPSFRPSPLPLRRRSRSGSRRSPRRRAPSSPTGAASCR